MPPMEDDIVMESTTDTPDQIAAGLEIPPALDADVDADAADASAEDDGIEAGAADVDEGGDDAEGDEPAAVVEPEKKAPARVARPQKLPANAAAAAARRKSKARLAVVEAENEALRERLKQIVAGKAADADADEDDPAPAAPAAGTVINPDDVPDTHPAVALVLKKISDLGPKPKQDDFEDFAAFEDKRDEWIEERARLRARADTVREDVARRESIALTTANRAAKATHDQWKTTVAASRARHEDYDEKMAAAREAGITLRRDVAQALMESEIGAEVIYYLVSNPAELTRINAIASPHRALAEAGKLEGRIAAGIRKPAAGGPAARTTKAPDPQSTLLGTERSDVGKGKSLDDPNLSQAEYNRLRDEQDIQSGRRRPH